MLPEDSTTHYSQLLSSHDAIALELVADEPAETVVAADEPAATVVAADKPAAAVVAAVVAADEPAAAVVAYIQSICSSYVLRHRR